MANIEFLNSIKELNFDLGKFEGHNSLIKNFDLFEYWPSIC
jgi:hypothetical protein